MKDITIRQRVIASFGAILLVMIALALFGYVRTEEIEAEANIVRVDTVPGLYKSALINETLADRFAFASQLLLQPTAEERATAEAELKKNRAELVRLVDWYGMDVRTGSDRKVYEGFRNALADYNGVEDALLTAFGNQPDVGRGADAISQRLYPAFRDVMTAAHAMSVDNNERATAATNLVDADLAAQQKGMTLAMAGVILASLLGGTLLLRAIDRPMKQLMELMEKMREGDFTQRMTIDRNDEFGALGEGFNRMAEEVMNLVGQVQKSGIRVSTSMTEIAATSKQQQATASEVAATTTEIGATSREISATSKELVRTMNEVASVAEHAAEMASSGQSGLQSMEETMRQVMDAAGSINAKLAVLNEKAGNINQVVTTITKVADQTNLLSLNAAIEAEKAGEYGRGFSVVSTEIRRLADQTAVATLDIEEMVKEIQSAVTAGVMGMDKFSEEVRRGMRDVQDVGGKLSQVIAQVQALVPRFETVNDGMQAQATGAEQISEALLQLTETTRQTVEALRQSNAAIEELNQVSGSLHGSISRFKLAA